MIFTGRNLDLVREALDLAHDELETQIATCPNVWEYADDIDECERKQAQLKKLRDRIDKNIKGAPT